MSYVNFSKPITKYSLMLRMKERVMLTFQSQLRKIHLCTKVILKDGVVASRVLWIPSFADHCSNKLQLNVDKCKELMIDFNPLSPGAFCEKCVFWTFWWFSGWISATLALIWSKMRLQHLHRVLQHCDSGIHRNQNFETRQFLDEKVTHRYIFRLSKFWNEVAILVSRG